MSDNCAHVALISDDRNLCALVKRHRPSGAVLRVVSPGALGEIEIPRADQYWIDLDSGGLPGVPDCHRRAYFFSKFTEELRKLPPGLFMRKPCTPAVVAVLWADVAIENAVAGQEARAGADEALPGWALELHELDLRELCEKIVNLLPDKLGYDEAALYLHDPEQRVLTLAKTNAKRKADLAIPLSETNQHALATTAMTQSVLISDDLIRTCRTRALTPPASIPTEGATVCGTLAPLSVADAVQGVLQLTKNMGAVAGPPKAPPTSLYGFLGRCLSHAQQHKLAKTEARVDQLTSLYNYRWMIESLGREIRRSQRYGSSLSMIMIDLDELKTVNDNFGHVAGDALLRHTARKIGSALRQIDSAARIGGDEFVVLLPSTDLKGAGQVGRRILAAISNDAPVINGKAMPVALSIGVAQWERGWNESRLIEAADQAMYTAKREGHNRMVCHPFKGSVASKKPASPQTIATAPAPASK